MNDFYVAVNPQQGVYLDTCQWMGASDQSACGVRAAWHLRVELPDGRVLVPVCALHVSQAFTIREVCQGHLFDWQCGDPEARWNVDANQCELPDAPTENHAAELAVTGGGSGG